MNKGLKAVCDFWEEASCGETLFLKGLGKNDYLKKLELRYQIEPYIIDFAAFDQYKNKKVLEIGVGLGDDHQKFAESDAILYGIDLTKRAVSHAQRRFEFFGLTSHLEVANAEALPFDDESFDLVYSWGVLHHSPDTGKSIEEVYRVLKQGGEAKVMIYHKYSIVGYMLWLRYAFIRLKPFTPMNEIYSKHLESPGTKAYSIPEARTLFNKFQTVDIRTVLGTGDTLSYSAGQKHRGVLLSLARLFLPRWFIKKYFSGHGLIMMIKAKK